METWIAAASLPLLALSAEPTRAQIDALGPPHHHDPIGDGLGAESHWGFQFECGLTLAIVAYGAPWRWDMWLVFCNEPEANHLDAHLGWQLTSPSPQVATGELAAARAFVVTRQDNAGNTFDICAMPTRAQAACYAKILEDRAHKQTYAVDQRRPAYAGPALAPVRRRFAIVRQDDLGHRFRVAIASSRKIAGQVVAAYEREPRHKQAYFVEPLSD